MNVVNIKIPARGKHRIESRGTIGFLSGDVPRLVVRAGSDAFDLWEGQCLPFEANHVYICNPFGADISVALIMDAPVSFQIAADIDSAARHYHATRNFLRLTAYPADAVKRCGGVFLAKKGRYEISADLFGMEQNQVRVSVVLGASLEMMGMAPPEMTSATHMVANTWKRTTGIEMAALFGLFTDAEVSAWMAATIATENLLVAHYDGMTKDFRFVTESTVAVGFSFAPGVDPVGNLIIRDLGMLAEDFD